MAISEPAGSPRIVHIRPTHGMRGLDFAELWQYRDLFYFMVWRGIKIRYAQSVVGVGWAIVQPVAFMIVFTVVFGNMAKVDSNGVPYAIFSFTALVPWTFFSTSFMEASTSLTQNRNMLTKIYFPRIVMPLSAVFGRLIDFSIALVIVFLMMAWYRMMPTVWALILPLLILLMVLTASGLGMWLTSLAVQYRDIKYGLTFIIQLLIYSAPVVYPVTMIPDQYRLIYGLNPMVGVIESFRAALLGTTAMPWDLLIEGTITSVIIALTGAIFFRRMERIFADVV